MFKKIIFGVSIVAGLALVLLFVVGTKKLEFDAMKEAGQQRVQRAESVATSIAQQQSWVEQLQAIGSIEPVQGVRLDAEVAGVVRTIDFKNGQDVEAGDVLVQLDVQVEQAQLRAHEATARLAERRIQACDHPARKRQSCPVATGSCDRQRGKSQR